MALATSWSTAGGRAKAWIRSLLLIIALLFSVPDVSSAILINAAFVGVARQVSDPEWSAWGIGIDRVSVSEQSLGKFTPPKIWDMELPLGLRELPFEMLLARSNSCQSQRLIAQRYFRVQQWRSAADVLEAAAELCTHYPYAAAELGLAYDRLGLPELAVSAFERGGVTAFGRELAAVNYLLLTTGCSIDQPRWTDERCARWLNRSLDLAPGHPLALVRLQRWSGPQHLSAADIRTTGVAWHDARLTAFAIEGLRQWTSEDPDLRRNTLLMIARDLGLQRQHNVALAVYRMLETDHPDDASLAFLSGLTASAVRDWQTASKDFARAVDLSPSSPSFLVGYGRALESLGQIESAAVVFNQTLAVEPCNPAASRFFSHHANLALNPNPVMDSQRQTCRQQLTQRYDPASMPTQVGRAIESGLTIGTSAVVGHGGIVVYGPYAYLPAGEYRATFRLRRGAGSGASCVVIDVSAESDSATGAWIADYPRRTLSPQVIPLGYAADFALQFESTGARGFEFRVNEQCGGDVIVEWIEVAPID